MNAEYRSKMYKVSFKPQWLLLGKERGYRQIVSEGGDYKCFQYHMDKRNALLDEVFECELGMGKYAKFSEADRKREGLRLREKEEAHHLKALIFATSCGITLC